MPVVSEVTGPNYPSADNYSSEEDWGSWSDTPKPLYRQYQERKVYTTCWTEGVYKEIGGEGRRFTFTYIPGVKQPIRGYIAHRLYPRAYTSSPAYQESPHPLISHRVLTEAESRANKRESAKVIQSFIKPSEEDLAVPLPSKPGVKPISDFQLWHIDKELRFTLEDNRPWPFNLRKEKLEEYYPLSYHYPLKNVLTYIKCRYRDWVWAGGLQSGEKFFIDLWDPKALEIFEDPEKDTHPRAILIKEWKKAKEQEKALPKRKRKRSKEPRDVIFSDTDSE